MLSLVRHTLHGTTLRRAAFSALAAASALAPALAFAGEVASPPSSNTTSLATVLREVVTNNHGLAAKHRAEDAADADTSAVGAHLYPVLRTEVNAMVWNSDNRYSFDTSGFQSVFAKMGAPAGLTVPPMTVTVRDQTTVKATVMAIQPLTQLFQISYGRDARADLARAARLDTVTLQRELESQVVRAFFGHLSARRMLETITEAERTVSAYEKQTNDYLAAGLVEKDALLQIQVQREELRKGRVAAEKGVELSRAQLNMLMGRPLDAPLELACTECTDASAESSRSLKSLQDEAITHRPELASGEAQRDAAAAGYSAARAKLAPDLNLVAAYNHNIGMGDLMPKDEAFVGLMLSWNVWEWGATNSEARAARFRREQAALMVREAEAGLRLQVHQRVLDLVEARKQKEVADAGLALAKEALRLEENRYAVHASEAADLIRVQVAAVKAAHDVTLATMQIELARRELVLATGHDLLDTANAPLREPTK
jgi:outer membrane protein TolC